MTDTPPRQDRRPPELLPAIGRIGAARRWAGTTRKQRQQVMRSGPLAAYADRWEKIARERHPDLDDADIAREAARIKSEHYSRMALAAARARSARKRGGGDA